MYAIYGSALTVAGILAVALLALLFGTPSAPRWTRREVTAQLISVVVAVVLGIGLALLALSPSQMLTDGVTAAELAALAGGLAVIWLVLRTLKVGARLRAHRASAGSGLTVATTEPPVP